ncbi:hypothetical protein DACRYDRAFT_22148 [Dacryopinax primogenitus]|uniref:Type I restriction enzyme R protein N-terminal domain-containing protein n=1 Tax=Dacryopinax primogenitus (strain DJM 731) TaxID=1858805 RepID=M5G0S9_DACPD|nr:uncharacterized protein DACRYDRAFT_22148 [Dacryopinax primogenitus]EJU01725.1 hypothetical protein DACRYDRAFT_22148 [Dacryopinax primogenitus]
MTTVFETLGYDTYPKGAAVMRQWTIKLNISGTMKTVTPDIVLIRAQDRIICLVCEDKREDQPKDPQAQVIAEAIAAFQCNNEQRLESGLKKLKQWTVPCITIKGTEPALYMVPVTKELNVAVMQGQYPNHVTRVKSCIMPWNEPKSRLGRTDMTHVAFRREALRMLVCFKNLVRMQAKIINEKAAKNNIDDEP